MICYHADIMMDIIPITVIIHKLTAYSLDQDVVLYRQSLAVMTNLHLVTHVARHPTIPTLNLGGTICECLHLCISRPAGT